MQERENEKKIGRPSDYGSRTPADAEEQQRPGDEDEDIGRTADGEPRRERGTADSAVTHDR